MVGLVYIACMVSLYKIPGVCDSPLILTWIKTKFWISTIYAPVKLFGHLAILILGMYYTLHFNVLWLVTLDLKHFLQIFGSIRKSSFTGKLRSIWSSLSCEIILFHGSLALSRDCESQRSHNTYAVPNERLRQRLWKTNSTLRTLVRQRPINFCSVLQRPSTIAGASFVAEQALWD